MTNPFDAALSLLRASLKGWEALWGEYAAAGKVSAKAVAQHEADDMKAAISVLEAAWTIDKELAIKTLRRLYHPRFNQDTEPVSVPIFDTIMPFLEALPDKEKA